jgi:hypothetical protein
MLFLALPLLVACPAEQLGVELPEGGVKAISAEDLQRDVHALTRPGADAGEVFAHRLSQMHLPPTLTGDGRVCGHLGGEDGARVIVAPWPAAGPLPPADAAQAAVLISLAKGWDGQAPPARATWLCLAKADATLPEGKVVGTGVVVVAQQIEAIDYRKLRTETQGRLRELTK